MVWNCCLKYKLCTQFQWDSFVSVLFISETERAAHKQKFVLNLKFTSDEYGILIWGVLMSGGNVVWIYVIFSKIKAQISWVKPPFTFTQMNWFMIHVYINIDPSNWFVIEWFSLFSTKLTVNLQNLSLYCVFVQTTLSKILLPNHWNELIVHR